ncbi:xanthine dehydrogenase molybdopterin binding subunit [Celerinatantimonas sp. YJH-8]|uniref:xanthine dehydrogenase molybdopterin binding subunit n=1 Tax=Celerinatantimonas sp. YJH-8 TaxID=3228714 RepID=UPI0038CBCC92
MRNLPPQKDATPSRQSGARPHESAALHVSGQARYVDDLREPSDLLHAAVGFSEIAAGDIMSMDFSPLQQHPDVIAVLRLADVPGDSDIGAIIPGDPLLTETQVRYYGQPMFAIAAKSEKAARRAVRAVKIDYRQTAPILDEQQAQQAQQFVLPTHCIERGEPEQALSQAPLKLSGELRLGGQEHFYLETQVALAIPDEDEGMFVYSSTQHPAEIQKLVAKVLNWPLHRVTVDMRRMGGGFGGKESQAAPWACMAALLAQQTGRPVKLRLPRHEDMIMTGKRHPFHHHYQVGFDAEGRLLGADLSLIGNCGHSPDLSEGIVDRAMFHVDNSYYLDAVRITGYRAMTNRVSNTAFRGFGGPQGMMLIEKIMDEIARKTGQDPLDVRKINLYGSEGRHTTPYGQQVEEDWLLPLIEQLEHSANYRQRREQITQFNQCNPLFKKGLALTPVKFGISFTAQHLNQAGALLQIYTDGSILVNHGGTEMGQGLHTKIIEIVARVFAIDISQIRISSTRTDKVPNTSPTAASSGTDLNGMATYHAAMTLKDRLIACLANHYQQEKHQIHFSQGQIQIGALQISFAEAVQLAYLNRVSLSATGFYKTPKIFYDPETGRGRPFLYYAFGAAVSEVLVDTLTGEYKVLQVDILHDVGQSLNRDIDIGQIEGGFIQGMGWVTTEELSWDAQGRLQTSSPATYKIPAISDLPERFHVEFFDRPNDEATIYRSKAVGEPPFMLAISVWSALNDAIASLSHYQRQPQLDSPATPERVLKAIISMQQEVQNAVE